MDYIKLQEQVKALKFLGEHLERMLKVVNLEVCDLPSDVLTLVDKCVEIQADGNLNEISLNNLRELYYAKKCDDIENKLTLAQQAAKLKKMQHDIEETNKDIAALETFSNSINKRLAPAAVQLQINEMEVKSKALMDRLKGLAVPENFNIETLIDKIELLKQKK